MPASSTTSKQQTHQSKIADELSHVLADTYLLYTKTQNFHWNVTGPHFFSLHEMFEDQYQELAEAIDTIAERIRALKAPTPGSLSSFLKLSSLKDETGVPSAEDMIKQLTKDHETIVHHLMIVFKTAEQQNDQATVDMLIERLRAHEKTAWMLRSSIK